MILRPMRPDEAGAVAPLVHAALPDFYDAIPLDHDATLALIAAETALEGTECHAPLVLAGDGVTAMACAYPAAELAARQQASLLHVMRALDRDGRRAFRAVARAATAVDPLPTDRGLYVPRIATAPDRRGEGLGARMVAALVERAGEAPLSLHVDAANEGAIRFYERHGFTLAPGDGGKRAMVRGDGERGAPP